MSRLTKKELNSSLNRVKQKLKQLEAQSNPKFLRRLQQKLTRCNVEKESQKIKYETLIVKMKESYESQISELGGKLNG